MSWRTLPPWNVAAAAVLFGGLLLIVFPQHAASIVQLVMVTVAVASGIYALIVSVPEWSGAWWMSPFNRPVHPRPESPSSNEIDRIRSALSGRRHPIQNGPPTPPEVLRLLQPLIRTALEREGLELEDPAHRESARERLRPLTWSLLTSDPPQLLEWYQTRRPADRRVAEVVHRVLDDLDRLAVANDYSRPDPDADHPRTT